ncbi:hypothetical protein BV25DRAFT_1845061 [Artomyces pyxidatus]|uniref:Uncharacterized protein n=1 Tax=Artomyces pyxidatus TaxID=48021 RepID=A0ACB8TKU7_9AGAM|nr:hypothetical protein BV25DRAFT_1845061 [Artomyces pyxidatus]
MSRSVLLSWRSPSSADSEAEETSELALPVDEAASPPSSYEALTSYQSVVFSPTYQVPVFYFEIHKSNGSPLSLTDILKTTLLHETLPEGEVTSFGLTPAETSFPVVSQGDHLTLGTPSWYIHPCGMPLAMEEVTSEIMAEAMAEGVLEEVRSEDDVGVRWMEVWFMILGNMVDLAC